MASERLRNVQEGPGGAQFSQKGVQRWSGSPLGVSVGKFCSKNALKTHLSGAAVAPVMMAQKGIVGPGKGVMPYLGSVEVLDSSMICDDLSLGHPCEGCSMRQQCMGSAEGALVSGPHWDQVHRVGHVTTDIALNPTIHDIRYRLRLPRLRDLGQNVRDTFASSNLLTERGASWAETNIVPREQRKGCKLARLCVRPSSLTQNKTRNSVNSTLLAESCQDMADNGQIVREYGTDQGLDMPVSSGLLKKEHCHNKTQLSMRQWQNSRWKSL